MVVSKLTSSGWSVLVGMAFFQGCKSESQCDSAVQARARQSLVVKDGKEATSRATAILGVPAEPPLRTAAESVVLHEDNTPFLSAQLIDRPLWKVTLHGYKLQLSGAIPGFPDLCDRVFDVLVDPGSGNVIKVISRWPDGVPTIAPEPPAWSAEEQMAQAGLERFHSFPEEPPTITFLRALDVVLTEGVGSPLVAKQIVGRYVVHSRMAGEPRPVWAITLRGIPPLPVYGPPELSGEDSRLLTAEGGATIIHNVVDARTGQWLGANTAPQPLWGVTALDQPGEFGEDLPIPIVTLDLFSPQDGLSLQPGEVVEWTITATVSSGDNDGLAMVAVNLIQDENPELIDIPPGVRPVGMEGFDRPNGISNPSPDSPGSSAYGGTPFGPLGATNLVQIGGAQNIFGSIGYGIGLDIQVDAGVGQGAGGQVIVRGALMAPCTLGVYILSLESGLANVLQQINPAPEFSLVRSAEIIYSDVQGGCGNCDEPHGGLGCSDQSCEDIVCGNDPFCCDVGWDQICADDAIQHCDCNATASPFSFIVLGSPVCPLDIARPGVGPPDGLIAVNDLLKLLADWFLIGVPADFVDPPGVGIEDLVLLLYYWGVCTCTQGADPPPIEDEIVDAGLVWPDDWETFIDCMTNGTPAEQENCACWMKKHLKTGGGSGEIEFQMSAAPQPSPTPQPGCPAGDPFSTGGTPY